MVELEFFKELFRACSDLCRKFCHGYLRCIPMGCLPDGCCLFYRTLMPTAYNLQFCRDLRSVKELMDYESQASHRDTPVNFLDKIKTASQNKPFSLFLPPL